MSGIVRGLAGLEKFVERSAGSGSENVKARWVRLDDGQVVKINFLQELDQDSPNFNAHAGAAFLAVEQITTDVRLSALLMMRVRVMVVSRIVLTLRRAGVPVVAYTSMFLLTMARKTHMWLFFRRELLVRPLPRRF